MLESGFVQYHRNRNILFKVLFSTVFFYPPFAFFHLCLLSLHSQTLLDQCVVTLVWWACGFAFAFGDGGVFWGSSGFFFAQETPSESLLIGECRRNLRDGHNMSFWVFELMFAATCCTIVSGAIAERVKWQGYMLYCFLFTLVIYPPIARALWHEGGFLGMKAALFGTGALDFAGGAVVHLVGGVAGLCGAVAVGYRNKFSMEPRLQPPRFAFVNGKWRVNELAPASEALAALGIFILWFSWFGKSILYHRTTFARKLICYRYI